MKIRNIRHKGLARFFTDGETKGVPANAVNKLNNILGFLEGMESLSELQALPLWKAHRLTGDRRATWSLSVTGNWRITFCHDPDENEIYDLNFEDYH